MDNAARGNNSNIFYFAVGDKWYCIKNGELFEMIEEEEDEDFRNH